MDDYTVARRLMRNRNHTGDPAFITAYLREEIRRGTLPLPVPVIDSLDVSRLSVSQQRYIFFPLAG